MIRIHQKKVLFSGQVALSPTEKEFTITLDAGSNFVVRFESDGSGRPSAVPRLTSDGITVVLNHFGNALGMTINGSASRFGLLSKPTAYTIVVHLIGDTSPTRLVSVTLTEAW